MKLRLQRDGRTFDLKDLNRIGSGGEAVVYELEGTPWAVKVYSKRVNGRDDKLRVMLANPPKVPTSTQGHVSIAWPQDLLIDQHDRIVGYVMPRVEQMRRMFDFYNPGTRRKKCPLFTYKYLVATALNLAIAVRALHQRGYVMGDVNESNFLVADNTMVTLVDTDSFQVREPGNGRIHHCTVASPLFTPREMQGVDFAITERREEQDLFGLGVLLFHLLMEGSHPFQARFTGAGDSPEPIEMIQQGNFPHGTGSAMWQPPPAAPAYGMLDPKLRSLFTRCFVNGHRDPKARPNADEWCSTLSGSLGILIQCKGNPSHIFWPHIDACPWCARTAKLRGRDLFPHPDEVRFGAHLSSAAPPRNRPVSQPTRPATPVATPQALQPAQNLTAPSTILPVAHSAQSPAVSWWKRIFTGNSPSAPPRSSLSQAQPSVAALSPPTTLALPTPTAPQAQRSTAAPQLVPVVNARQVVDLGGGTRLLLCGVPAGTFTMGGNLSGEESQVVTLTKGFWLGETTVTQRQWQNLMGSNPSSFHGAGLPVENVSWLDAMDFCGKLNEKKVLPTGWYWTLPTEAQWEYACRAGTTGAYAGDLNEMAWYSSNSRDTTHCVGEKKPNAWGLCDMHGNVCEWCADCYGHYKSGVITDPTGPSTGESRVYRGGSWLNSRANCSSDNRFHYTSTIRENFLGFRVAAVSVNP